MVEKLRQEILSGMVGIMDDVQTERLERVLDIVLHEYDITKKSRELSLLDHSNEVILKNFLGCKKIEGYSPNTIKHYNETIKRMLDDIGKNFNEINTNDIRHHLAQWQVTRSVSNATLENMRKAYNSFFKWLFNEKYISENPMLRIKAFKVHKNPVKPFTEKEMEQLCENCKTVRERALIEFLYSTGCRVSECVSITFDDIDFKNNTVNIRHGKGDKERVVYISDKCMYWLEKYIETRTDNLSALWVGKRGQLTKGGIETIVRKIGNSVNVYAHPHKFRHTLASNMAKRNAPVQIIQKILGHEDINTTMIYISVDNKDVEGYHRKLVA